MTDAKERFDAIVSALGTPYYTDGKRAVYCSDCRELLPLIEPGSVDLVLTDPPYSISISQNHERQPGKGTRRFDFFEGDRDWVAMAATVTEAIRMASRLAPSLYVWCGHRQFGPLTEQFEADGFSTRFLVWRKACPPPAPPGVGWWSAAELCIYAFRKGRKWTPPIEAKCHNVIDSDSYRYGQPGKVDHPTQKPLPVMAIPMEYSTEPGDLVLDCFLGSGTTLRAAKDLDRYCIGIELEERYCEIAKKRLAQSVLEFSEA